MSSMWAILVGVETYRSEAVGHVSGALRDVERMRALLVDDLHVPADHIVVLKNEEACRQVIIDLFRSVAVARAFSSHS
jgi:hypothetical protein